jgi:uncharacterized protein (TIGR02599 family)
MRRLFRSTAFTLVEVLVSITILTMILLIVTSVIGQAQRSWKLASSRLGQFRESRLAFEAVVRNLRQSIIDSQYDYDWDAMVASGAINNPLEAPGVIQLTADLGFVCGPTPALFNGVGSGTNLAGNGILFQAPLGFTGNPDLVSLRSLLNTRGYFVQFGDDQRFLPQGLRTKLQPRGRYRLLEFRPTAEVNNVFADGPAWATQDVNAGVDGNLVPLAENIVLFVAACVFPQTGPGAAAVKFGEEPAIMNTDYNSYTATGVTTPYTLPSGVRITMVSIDETSAARLSIEYGNGSPNLLGRSGVSFANPANLNNDLEKFGQFLTSERINYRAYSAYVVIPAADQY